MSVDEKTMDNCGASSIYEIDFSNRTDNDPDKNRSSVQKNISVYAIRLDTFCNNNNITKYRSNCYGLIRIRIKCFEITWSVIKKCKIYNYRNMYRINI